MAESLFSYGPDLPYDQSGAAYGVNFYPNAATFLPNEAQAVQETPYPQNGISIPLGKPSGSNPITSAITNSINSLFNIPPTDSAGLQTNSPGYAQFNASSPSGIVSDIESYVGSGALRIGVVVLGFILVASGLTMFKNGELKISVKP